MVFTIGETGEYWVAERESSATPLELKSKDTSKGKVLYETGSLSGEKVLREILYPKSIFTKEEVLNIVKDLEDKCPLCKRRSGEAMPESIFEPLDRFTKDEGISRAIGSELLTLVPQEIGNILLTELGQRILYLGTGLALLGAGAATTNKRAKVDAYQMGMHMINVTIDPSPDQLAAIQAQITALTQGLTLGSGQSILGALIRNLPPINLPPIPPLSLGPITLPSLNLPPLPQIPGLPTLNLSPQTFPPAPAMTSQIVIPPQAVSLGGGTVPLGDVDVSQFSNLSRVAVF
jgi:hypothetical protein